MQNMNCSYVNHSLVKSLLRKRPLDAHKGIFGHGFLVAGKKGMAGAALLAAKACLRSGVGKLTILTQDENRLILQTGIPEAILSCEPSTNYLMHINTLYNAIGIGPGIGHSFDVYELERLLFDAFTKPMVIDADAINIIVGYKELINQIPSNSILTPHKAEFDRLMSSLKMIGDPLKMAMELAKQKKVIIVMKGPFTKIVSPDGHVYVNTTGNPGMATAGSGDVLTGMILAFLSNQGAELT